MHHIAKGSETLKELRDGPKTSSEITPPSASGSGVRPFTKKLFLSTKSIERDWGIDRGMTDPIYYLVGDERRAARRFVELYPEFVDECSDETYTPIHTLNDFMRDLIFQEYEIMKYNGEI